MVLRRPRRRSRGPQNDCRGRVPRPDPIDFIAGCSDTKTGTQFPAAGPQTVHWINSKGVIRLLGSLSLKRIGLCIPHFRTIVLSNTDAEQEPFTLFLTQSG